MAYVAQVQNGKIVDPNETSKTDSTQKTTKSKSGGLGEQDFLELLVAEMQYQDPLEPQTNTDYIAQLATFTQVQDIEDMQNVVTSMKATGLVGKYVVLNVTSPTTGENSTVTGPVDYVQYENGKAFLNVNGAMYSIDDLEAVSDEQYYEALAVASQFSSAVHALPSLESLTTSDENALAAAKKLYTDMTTYQKKYVSTDDLKTLAALEDKLTELKAGTSTGGSSSTDGSTSGTGDSTSTNDTASTTA